MAPKAAAMGNRRSLPSGSEGKGAGAQEATVGTNGARCVAALGPNCKGGRMTKRAIRGRRRRARQIELKRIYKRDTDFKRKYVGKAVTHDKLMMNTSGKVVFKAAVRRGTILYANYGANWISCVRAAQWQLGKPGGTVPDDDEVYNKAKELQATFSNDWVDMSGEVDLCLVSSVGL